MFQYCNDVKDIDEYDNRTSNLKYTPMHVWIFDGNIR
jgi:hypothetical protein